jgi:phosphotriesterase-related protein
MSEHRSSPLTRREALQLIGTSAVAAALPVAALAQRATWPEGAIIRTLLKDYRPEELQGGATLFHEHLSLAADFNDKFRAAAAAVRAANGTASTVAPAAAARSDGPPPDPPGPDPMRDVDLMAEELAEARRQGVACIVDAGHPDMGRDLDFVRQASLQAGMPVVAGAGFYAQPFYTNEIATMSEDEIVQALIKQVDAGPAGVFGEIGSWDEITAVERKVFRAVGKAHRATNLPIITHTGIPGKSALEQLDILEDAGVKPDRVVIGHLGNLVDADVYVHKTLCRRGAFVGFDRQGGNGDATQVPMVMALIDAGFADHLLFSSDASRGYGKTLTAFVPKLKAAGATDEILHRILVDNSRRFLAFVPKRPRTA